LIGERGRREPESPSKGSRRLREALGALETDAYGRSNLYIRGIKSYTHASLAATRRYEGTDNNKDQA